MSIAKILKSFWGIPVALGAGITESAIQVSSLGLEWRLILVAFIDICLMVTVIQLLYRWAKPPAAAGTRPKLFFSIGAAGLLMVLMSAASFYIAHAVIVRTSVRIIEKHSGAGNQLQLFGSNSIVQAVVSVPPKGVCRTFDIAGYERAASLKVNGGGPDPGYRIQNLVFPQGITVDCGANELGDNRVQLTPADAQVLRSASVRELNRTVWISGGIIWLVSILLAWRLFR